MAITFDYFVNVEVWERGISGPFGSKADLGAAAMSYQMQSGKGDRFSQYQTATLTVTFTNADNRFDPTYETVWNSPGGLPSKFGAPLGRLVGVGTLAGGHFTGYITDWDFSYTPDGNSIVVMTAKELRGYLATKPLPEIEAPSELSGERVERILLASGLSDISLDSEFGLVKMQAETIPEGTLALEYLNAILDSEWGTLQDTGGAFTLKTRIHRPKLPGTHLTSADGIVRFGNSYLPFNEIEVSYGTDVLYNNVTVQNENGALVKVVDQDSIDYNGEKKLTLTGLRGELDSDAVKLATYLADEYSVPELRVDGVSFALQKYDIQAPPPRYRASPEQYDLGHVELGDVVYVEFAPAGSDVLVQQYSVVNRIEMSGVPGDHRITFGLEPFAQYLLLDDTTFGKLDSDNILGQDYRYWILDRDLGIRSFDSYCRLSAGMVLG